MDEIKHRRKIIGLLELIKEKHFKALIDLNEFQEFAEEQIFQRGLEFLAVGKYLHECAPALEKATKDVYAFTDVQALLCGYMQPCKVKSHSCS